MTIIQKIIMLCISLIGFGLGVAILMLYLLNPWEKNLIFWLTLIYTILNIGLVFCYIVLLATED